MASYVAFSDGSRVTFPAERAVSTDAVSAERLSNEPLPAASHPVHAADSVAA